jgi:hypothetical protein
LNNWYYYKPNPGRGIRRFIQFDQEQANAQMKKEARLVISGKPGCAFYGKTMAVFYSGLV